MDALPARSCTCGSALAHPWRFCPRFGSPVAGAETAGFFVPPFTRRDAAEVMFWVAGLGAVLGFTLGSLTLPPDGRTASVATPVDWLVRVVAVLFVGGAVGGGLLRRRGRWREVVVGSLLLGGLAAYFAFDGFALAHTARSGCPQGGDPCDMTNTMGAALGALPAALAVMIGGLGGRAVVLLARRSPG